MEDVQRLGEIINAYKILIGKAEVEESVDTYAKIFGIILE
jgi:hypothetical protein